MQRYHQKKVGLVFGGKSEEHIVSIQSAVNVYGALCSECNHNLYTVVPFYVNRFGFWESTEFSKLILSSDPTELSNLIENNDKLQKKEKKKLWCFPPEASDVDVFFPLIHGKNGEDGTIQGLFELMQVPYVGCKVLGSALGMDKVYMKKCFESFGIPQTKFIYFTRFQLKNEREQMLLRIKNEIGFPCFVKPSNQGSSVGISKVDDVEHLLPALEKASLFDDKIIVEVAVRARELACGVIGKEKPIASSVWEISYPTAIEFYDFETKIGNTGHVDVKRASISSDTVQRIQELSIKAFKAIDGNGFSRIDFFYLDDGELLVVEINTLPGFTDTSSFPLMWQDSGIPLKNLVHLLIRSALEE